MHSAVVSRYMENIASMMAICSQQKTLTCRYRIGYNAVFSVRWRVTSSDHRAF